MAYGRKSFKRKFRGGKKFGKKRRGKRLRTYSMSRGGIKL